jgi:hypothetical protein
MDSVTREVGRLRRIAVGVSPSSRTGKRFDEGVRSRSWVAICNAARYPAAEAGRLAEPASVSRAPATTRTLDESLSLSDRPLEERGLRRNWIGTSAIRNGVLTAADRRRIRARSGSTGGGPSGQDEMGVAELVEHKAAGLGSRVRAFEKLRARGGLEELEVR